MRMWRRCCSPITTIWSAPHIRSAKVNVQTSDDRECQASERVGRICRRNKHPDRGSDNKGVAPNHRPPSVGWLSLPPWGVRYAEPEDLSPAVAHDQQSIKQPERDGRNDKQVHRRDPIVWFRRNVFQPCNGGRLLRTIYFATLVCPTSIPSL